MSRHGQFYFWKCDAFGSRLRSPARSVLRNIKQQHLSSIKSRRYVECSARSTSRNSSSSLRYSSYHDFPQDKLFTPRIDHQIIFMCPPVARCKTCRTSVFMLDTDPRGDCGLTWSSRFMLSETGDRVVHPCPFSGAICYKLIRRAFHLLLINSLFS